MKRFRHYLMYMAVLSLVMVSCSKDENPGVVDGTDEVATLSFGAVVNDLIKNSATKQALEDIPECSEEAPAYVHVVLTGPEDVGSMEDPLVVEVNPTPGDYDNDGEDEYFTEYSSDLELIPGSYSLEYFAVYDENDNLIWVAPGAGSPMEDWVDMALPMDIELGAGVKKYVDVTVLCFDDRMVNLYGYQFFDIEGVEGIELCIFGNWCDESGRHYVADYSVNIWSGTDNTGDVLYIGENEVETDNAGDEYSDPLCLFLPDGEGQDDYYIEITIDGEIVREGTFTDSDVKELFDGEDAVDYYHFFAGSCSSGDTPDIFGDNGNGGPPPVIDQDTEIYIYFDSSGSMNSTLSPLQTMRNTLLKDALLPLYGNDEDEYDAKVRVIENGTEGTFDMLNIEGDTPDGNVIAVVFQDEAETTYHSGQAIWDENSTRTANFDNDMSVLRGRLASFPMNYYRGIIFQVNTQGHPAFDNFEELIHAVEDGTGNYSGSNGLSDRNEFAYVYEVNGGDTAQYYTDLLVQTLQDLGYDL
ncbi:hypothetical protein SAMN05660776_0406 [Salegentibacter holothuriorum]|uniref:VWFA domain-containing protein n=1 Tax=Salegentibacter holothuriorum TaxID=241145 RepID=A0A1T5ACE0_9FLAO|nr:hypothetical protein [Salegentibacter holothuriorum]SKB32576.1 hypothetical protein SAMN05660776_0406 [Salegentibacter holothuriorum]